MPEKMWWEPIYLRKVPPKVVYDYGVAPARLALLPPISWNLGKQLV